MAVLPNLEQQNREQAELIAKLTAALAAKTEKRLTWKVGRKGNIVFHGFGKFPISMYLGQFERFVDAIPEIEGWIKSDPKTTYAKDEYGEAGSFTLTRK